MESAEAFELSREREQVLASLAASPEVRAMAEGIDIHDMASITGFGSGAAQELSRVSDDVLRNMSGEAFGNSGEILGNLAGLMAQVNIRELEGEEKPGFFARLLKNAKSSGSGGADRVLDKYRDLGGEIDRAFIQIRQFEDGLKRDNRDLNRMFDASLRAYRDLMKAILAGEEAVGSLRAKLARTEDSLRATGDQRLQFELVDLRQALDVLERRVHDLRLTETVAMQSLPMLKMMEHNNESLINKLDAAVIVTFPAFKRALGQAIARKRAALQAQSMAVLDAKADRAIQSAGGQSGELESTWNTIRAGLEETKALAEAGQRELAGRVRRLEAARRGAGTQ